ncbi:hypothetical protein VTN00DRAFT_1910 [Thermoascus crustaceus]|uniref:uncharacterized protein n=1 Tax=Thermoascus crustaceus TaxID=5088 RepID=UPI003743BB24
MDPLTAISLATSIVQFVDLGTKLIHGAREIYSSAYCAPEENEGQETVVSEMRSLSSKLLPPSHFQGSKDERALCRLAAECNTISDQILALLEKVQAQRHHQV